MIASEKRNGKREFFLELRSMRCFQVSWVLVFFRKTRRRLHDYFWLGAGTGLFFGTSKLLACLQPNDDDFGILFFGLRTYPMLTTYLLLFCFSVPGSYLSTTY